MGITERERQKLADALRGPLDYSAEPEVKRIMEQCAAEDLRVIEPILEDMLLQAENRGRLRTYLEIGGAGRAR